MSSRTRRAHVRDAATCRRTFQEAFERTGRVANINISVGARSGGLGAMRGALLLNHLTTPHVLLRSAVHASCCLPTVMNPTTLLAKASNGEIHPFEQVGAFRDDDVAPVMTWLP